MRWTFGRRDCQQAIAVLVVDVEHLKEFHNAPRRWEALSKRLDHLRPVARREQKGNSHRVAERVGRDPSAKISRVECTASIGLKGHETIPPLNARSIRTLRRRGLALSMHIFCELIMFSRDRRACRKSGLRLFAGY
jgi:hypothetical protein